MILQREISKLAERDQIPEVTIEKDYAIHWLMAGLSTTGLHKDLAFKGGTCLRLCHFDPYRYSEDVDVTARRPVSSQEVFKSFATACRWAHEKSGLRLAVLEDRLDTHQDGFSFSVQYQGPLQAGPGRREIKIDVSFHEQLVYAIDPLPIAMRYTDLTQSSVNSYSLQEIVVEKYRSLLNPARKEPRDVYDLWYVSENTAIVIGDLSGSFAIKAKFKSLDPAKLVETLSKKEKALQMIWEKRLENQISDLPPFDKAYRIVQRGAKKISA